MALPPGGAPGQEQQIIDWEALMRDCAPPEWDLLLSAAAKNDLSRIQDLVEHRGVPVSHGNAVGQTALHVACLWGHVDCVRYLVAQAEAGNNANNVVNAANKLSGATPLHATLASHKTTAEQQVALVRVLLDEGEADPLVEDDYGKCAIDYVSDASHPLHRSSKQYPQLVQRLTPPPPGIDRFRANFLKQIQRDVPSCRTAS